MKTFHVKILTLNETLLDSHVQRCRIRTEKGAIGLEAKHETFLATIKPNTNVEVTTENDQTKTFGVNAGMLRFEDNVCTIILD